MSKTFCMCFCPIVRWGYLFHIPTQRPCSNFLLHGAGERVTVCTCSASTVASCQASPNRQTLCFVLEFCIYRFPKCLLPCSFSSSADIPATKFVARIPRMCSGVPWEASIEVQSGGGGFSSRSIVRCHTFIFVLTQEPTDNYTTHVLGLANGSVHDNSEILLKVALTAASADDSNDNYLLDSCTTGLNSARSSAAQWNSGHYYGPERESSGWKLKGQFQESRRPRSYTQCNPRR